MSNNKVLAREVTIVQLPLLPIVPCTPLWLLKPVDGLGGETKSKTWALTPGPGGDLIEDSVHLQSSIGTTRSWSMAFWCFHSLRGLVTNSLSR